MPFPNEHAARVENPGKFIDDTFRRKEIAPGVSLVMGKLKTAGKGGSMVTQSYRFKADKFTAAEARAWLKEHEIDFKSFEAATGEKSIELRDFATEIQQRWKETFGTGGDTEWVVSVFDDHLIVRTFVSPGGEMWKVPFTVVRAPVEGDPNGLEVLESITFTPRAEWIKVVPTFVAVKTFDQPDGRQRWVTVSSGAFKDREGEIVSTAFLEDAIRRADKSGHRGTLDFWHIPGTDLGECDYQALVNGFLLESGLFHQTAAGQRAAQALKERGSDYGASIQFFYTSLTPEGVYTPPGLIVRRSILPRRAAAFPWSMIEVGKELTEMAIQIDEKRRKALVDLVGEEAAQELLSSLELKAESLKQLGIQFKEITDAEAARLAGDPEPGSDPEPDLEPDPEPEVEGEPPEGNDPPVQETQTEFDFVLSEEALQSVAKSVTAEIAPSFTPILEGLQGVQAALKKMSEALTVLTTADDQRLAEKMANLPRALLRRAAAHRPTQVNSAVAAGGSEENFQERGMRALFPES